MREAAKSFMDLIVWQKAHGFVLEVYPTTQNFPNHELYGLVPQFRLLNSYRSSVLKNKNKGGNYEKYSNS